MWIKYQLTYHNDNTSDMRYREFDNDQTDDYIKSLLEYDAVEDGAKSVWFERIEQPSIEHLQTQVSILAHRLESILEKINRYNHLISTHKG
jgi:hypothetical protein